MIDRHLNIPFKDNPVLLDKILQDIQLKLKTELSWLNYAFGRAYRLVTHEQNGDKFVYPAIYAGDNEYLSVNPNDNFGNFSWFDIYDPQNVVEISQGLPQLIFNGAIVFWFNLKTIYSDASVIYSEEVKNEILSILTSPGLLASSGRISITKIYERFENIYRGYSIEKIYSNYMYSGENIQGIDKQFFMFPYSALRFEFNITTRELCSFYRV